MGGSDLNVRIIIGFDGGSPDLFDSEDILDEGGGLQEGLLVRHQGEQKKNKVVPGCQALRHSFRLDFENQKYTAIVLK